MSKDVNSTKVIVPCRFSYLHCWEPDSVNGGDPKYSVSAIIPKSDTKTIEAIKAAIEQAKKDSISKWGGKVPANLKLPLRDGDIDRRPSGGLRVPRVSPVAQRSTGKIGHFGPESGLSAAWPCNPRTNTAGPRPRREEHREPDTSPDPADVIPRSWRYAMAGPGPIQRPRRKEPR